MNTKQRTATIFVLLLSLAISSCAPGQLFGPTVTPTPLPTLTPTLTPTATNTPVPPTATDTPIPPTATNTPISTTAANTPAVLVGDFSCSIPLTIQGQNNMVILGFTITPEHKIGKWSLFDFGTRTISFPQSNPNGDAIPGNAIQFTLKNWNNGMNITYKINGTIVSAHEMTGDYSFDYGSSYGVVADKFDCDLTPPARRTTPTP